MTPKTNWQGPQANSSGMPPPSNTAAQNLPSGKKQRPPSRNMTRPASQPQVSPKNTTVGNAAVGMTAGTQPAVATAAAASASSVAAAAQRPALQHSVSVPDGSVTDRAMSQSGISSPRSVPAPVAAAQSPAPPKSNIPPNGPGSVKLEVPSLSNPGTPGNLTLPLSVAGGAPGSNAAPASNNPPGFVDFPDLSSADLARNIDTSVFDTVSLHVWFPETLHGCVHAWS